MDKLSVTIFNDNEDREVNEIFKKYIELGKIIKKDPSKFHADFKSHDAIVRILSESGKYKSVDYQYSLDQLYIALAAPSLTGKTQSAFVIRSKLPLYFVSRTSQLINKPFNSLTGSLYSIK